MRRCCLCCSVHAGSFVLGVLGVALAGLELAVLIPFLLDLSGFNPIRENLDEFFFVVEKMVKEGNNATQDVFGDGYTGQITPEEARAVGEEWLRTALIAEAVFACIYLLFAFLMSSGIACKKRGLMLPYLILQMVVIIIFIFVGICASVFFFFLNVVMGCVALGVTLVAAFLFGYFWSAVQKAYVELGNRDYMYSPAPVKPIYNPMENKYHPSAPQHFNLE